MNRAPLRARGTSATQPPRTWDESISTNILVVLVAVGPTCVWEFLKGTERLRMKNLQELPKLGDSISYLYLEHAVIEQNDTAIVATQKEGRTPTSTGPLCSSSDLGAGSFPVILQKNSGTSMGRVL